MLKSDQNGIEIKKASNNQTPREIVKIRPKWDWNFLNINSDSFEIR